MTEPIDIAVVGAGPCGLAVGIAAQGHGLSCVHFDKGCVTRSLTLYPRRMEFFSTPERLELGGIPFTTQADKPVRLDALKYYRKIVDYFALDVHQYEEVVSIERAGELFRLGTRTLAGDAEYHARNIVIATGYFDTPNRIDVPGEDLPNVTHYFDEPEPYYGQDCIVVGGGNSAVDTALALYRAGARVRLVHLFEALDQGVKPWVLPDITNRLKAGDIEALWRTRITRIGPDFVDAVSEDGGSPTRLENDWVFLMTGYRPDHGLLRGLGVDIDAETGKPVHDEATMLTNAPAVYIAGVTAAGFNANKIFIENGRHHGARIAAHIAGAEPAEIPDEDDGMSDGMLAARGLL